MTVQECLSKADAWENSVNINRKYAVGTVASSKYDYKVETFTKVHNLTADRSNLYPLSCYYGKKPDPEKDRFDRRTVK